MTRPLRTRLLTAVAATITGAALVSTSPAYAISGGSAADTTTQPFLAKIHIGNNDAACSGALVAPQWLVTSAACFAAIPSKPEKLAPGAPHTATTATIDGKHKRSVDRIVPREDRDLVLAHLDQPVTGVTPATVATTAPGAGHTLLASGYGRTTDQWVPAEAHTGEFTVESVGSGSLNLQGADDNANICKGDAGGPVLRTGDQGPEIVAVASGSRQAGCIGETSAQTGATATRVDDLADWMASEVVALQATPATKNAINLSWTAMTGNYRIYGAQNPNVAIEARNLLGETTENRFTHTSVPAGQTWYYRVAVLDTNGAQVALSNTVQAKSRTATVTDFNGDGKDDIATFKGTLTSVAVSDGDRFGAASQWSSNLAGNGAIPLTGDFNGDGISDVVTFNNGPVNVALSDGQKFGPTQRWHDHFGLSNQKVAVGDVNGDGKDDIIAFSGRTYGDVFVALSTGTQFLPAQKWHDRFALGTETPAVGDFNGDGKADIVTFTDSGAVYVPLSDGTRFVQDGWKWHNRFSPTGEIPAVGDFNGDGKDDIVTFLRGDTGYVYVSLSTGDSFVEDNDRWNDFFSIRDEWPGVGDFNGDGKADVVTFTRGGRAQVYVARSDGTAFEDGTEWHGDFAGGLEYPLPSAHR
ncbi:FG-GAP-like repeat-containing protein [Saccharopolyspora sp. WRP15-2]|uniref:FG-GAP-like repeat-containing protein n=1 Tax=Saccharopolyspora oryzae TaxID=2997343 RepID=A0ABT4UVB6_9PSEU|nr:FG-GAP-like repeat-containing protein [Saccharopolyspora oryzae]MDA3625656.1 FG-GAP-like repeat-containing protein [Saccharopolyspora oryzae]